MCWHMQFGSTIEISGLHSFVVLEKVVVVLLVFFFSVLDDLVVELVEMLKGN